MLLLHPIGFELWCFYCHLFLEIFFISVWISSVTCWLFRSMFNLHVFVFLTVFFLWLISSLIVLWSEKTLDTIFLNLLMFVYVLPKRALKFTDVWFVTQDVVYPGECSMCTWGEGIFFCIWMECPEDINEIHLIYCLI